MEVETRFNDWFSRMCEYGFAEGEDFYSFLSKSPTGGRPAQDALLTIDMAKEICMLQRNEKGKIARQYFLAMERVFAYLDRIGFDHKWETPSRFTTTNPMPRAMPYNCVFGLGIPLN